jgi:ABC-type amino acid transport substrate-binding protein
MRRPAPGKIRATSLLLALALALSIPPCAAAAEERVRYFQKGQIYDYRIRLLELVLEKTRADYGLARAIPIPEDVTQARGLEMIQAGTVDIATLGTSIEREAEYLPVRIDILRGMLGYRVFLIRSDRQKDFLGAKDIEGLRRFRAGFGSQWADMDILKANRLPVEGVANSSTLIPMLAGGRIDYYPRGINEAWVELSENRAAYPQLAIESGLALFYPYPVYFFVRKDNARLAERIRRGLEAALRDGSFKELFLRCHGELIAAARLGERRLIRLENPALPKGTPPVDTGWWLSEKL